MLLAAELLGDFAGGARILALAQSETLGVGVCLPGLGAAGDAEDVVSALGINDRGAAIGKNDQPLARSGPCLRQRFFAASIALYWSLKPKLNP